MKTAEEIANEIQHSYYSTHLPKLTIIDMVKGYAKQACREQRKICEKVYVTERVTNLKSSVKSIAHDIKNAPEPELK